MMTASRVYLKYFYQRPDEIVNTSHVTEFHMTAIGVLIGPE